jgi:asparagine synthetase B (glutamine-hydrolysing)
MLLQGATRPDDVREDEPGLRWWRGERFVVGWKGHLYLPGRAAGAASAEAVAAALARGEDLAADVAPRLAGVFGLFVADRERGGWRVAVDNAGQYKVYADGRGVATSLLGLVRARGRLRPGDLDRAALVEYLAHGAVFAPRTFVAGVAKLRAGEVLDLPADGSAPRRLAKALPERPAEGADEAVRRHFAELARSLEGLPLSVDATGGFDSRLVVCLLDREGVPFELATSGHAGTPEVEIAREIARLTGRPFHLAGHDLGALDAALAETFEAGGGVTDLRRFHRDLQNARARLARGVRVIAHGGGGEFYRDHTFVQDFPRYGSPRVNLGRYYDLRMSPVPLPPGCLGAEGRELLAGLRAATLARFEELRAATNNETYDRIYFHLRSPEHFGQHYANYVNMGLDVAAPLLDRANALAAIALPPWRRFFYGWHRRMITRARPDLARLPTADGFSASSEPARMAADAGAFAATQLRRLGKKASQRLAGKSRFHNVGAFAADVPGFTARLRASPHFADALERLAAAGVLGPPGVAAEALRDIHVGRVLTLGLFLREVEGLG